MNNDKEWYTECTDRCGICFRLPLRAYHSTSGYFFYCKNKGTCSNTSKPDKNIALAVCKWNIKQRKIRDQT